jgi:deoxyadenosine/deoxycytidine kinase
MEINLVQGGIGCGKSTLLDNLEKNHGAIIVPEAVTEWCEDYAVTDPVTGKDQNILHLFYQDQRRWAFTFQMMVLMNRYRHIKSVIEFLTTTKKYGEPVQVFIERSCDVDKNVFAMNCKENGHLSEMEWRIYCSWCEQFQKDIDLLLINSFIHKIRYIFIDVSGEVCYERMKHRNRSEEAEVPLEYLKQINDKHRSWMERLKTYPFPVHKISYHSIDGTKSQEDMATEAWKIVMGSS